MQIARRQFILQTALATTGLGLVPFGSFSQSKTGSPSDRVNVGLIGCGNRGIRVLNEHLALDNVRCLGMCDVNEELLETKAAEIFNDAQNKPKLYGDYRRMLDDKDIDAVIVATPDHWHCLPTVHACEANKDVYVEKPLANTIEECNIMQKAVRRYGRVVQVGQQQRSGEIWIDIMNRIKRGEIGKLYKTNIWANFSYGLGPEKLPEQPVPQDLDFDFWLGPAPDKEYRHNIYDSWRHFWDYGGGLMTDFGAHLIDMALWAKGITTPPSEVLASGGNFTHLERDRETFDTLSVIYPLEDYTISWQQNASAKAGPYGMIYGLEFIGDQGTIAADRKKWILLNEEGVTEHEPDFHYPHAENFISCVKSRDEPNCTIEMGRNVALYSHMGNIAVRSGESRLLWDNPANKFSNSAQATSLITPEYRKPWKLPKV